MALRVAFLNHVGSVLSGAERSLASAVQHLPSDISAMVVLFEDGAFANELRSRGIHVEIIDAPREFMSTRRERMTLGSVASVPSLAVKVADLLMYWHADVLYTNSMKAHVVGSIAGRLATVPCVMHMRDHMSGLGLGILRATSHAGSTYRIACSRAVRDGIGLKKTSVVYSGIDRERFTALPDRAESRAALGLDQNLPTVSLLGRINRWKGHDRFVRIAKLVNDSQPTQFVIAGSPIFRDADFLPDLRQQVRAMSLERFVRFVPWAGDVTSIYAASDIVVNCSTREPLGRTPAEAAAAGIPSVVFDDSGAAEWIDDRRQGRIVPAHDERIFASEILDLFAEGALTHAHAEAIRQSSMRFDSRVISHEISNVIRNVAASRRRVEKPAILVPQGAGAFSMARQHIT